MPSARTITVGTSPTPLWPTRVDHPYTINSSPVTGTVYVGGRLVAASGEHKGRAVAPGDEWEAELDAGQVFYAVAASGTVEVSSVTDVDE